MILEKSVKDKVNNAKLNYILVIELFLIISFTLYVNPKVKVYFNNIK